MKKLLIATRNPGKHGEIKQYLSDLPITLVSPGDLKIKDRPVENGKSFEENAILKAKFYTKLSDLPSLADDGGFEIDALGGEPGIASHRWIHHNREDDDEELILYTLKRLKGVPLPRRGAQLRLVLALVFPDGTVRTVEEYIRGIIPLQPSPTRVKGFPYRSLLYLPKLMKFYHADDLTPEENEIFNHRKRALDRLRPFLSRSPLTPRRRKE